MLSSELPRFVSEAVDVSAQEQQHLAEIEKGLAEADRGDFATEEEMRTLYRKGEISRPYLD